MSRSTLRSSFAISAAVMASRVLGVVRDALFLAIFPVGRLTDAYGVAFQIPNLLRDLFAEGALSSAFVPTFSDTIEKKGKDAAYQLGNLVLTALIISTVLLTVAGLVFVRPLVALISADFAGDVVKLNLTTTLTMIMMPILVFVSAGAAWMGMLNAQSRFVAPAMAPAMFNVVVILCGGGLLLVGKGDVGGLYIFSAATLLAAVVQTFVQLPALWRMGYRPALGVAGIWSHPGVRRIVRLMAPAVLGLAAIQINVIVNTRFASELGDGPVTYLRNAFRLFYLPIGLFGVALATVTTTRVAEEAARGDRQALLARNADGLRAVWMLASASGVGLILLAQPIVTMIFERGHFRHEHAIETARVLQMYMLGVLPYSLMKNLAPAFYAIERSRVPMVASMVSVAVNVAFNWATYRTMGAPGLALGTTLAALINMIILRVCYRSMLGSLATPGWSRHAGALLLANGLLAALVLGFGYAGVAVATALGFDPMPGRGAFGAAWLLLTIGAGFVIFTRVLDRLGYTGAHELTGLPGKLWRRLRARA